MNLKGHEGVSKGHPLFTIYQQLNVVIAQGQTPFETTLK